MSGPTRANRNGGSMSITADNESAVLESVPTRLLIGGEWREASNGATLPVAADRDSTTRDQ